ncbi:MAG TPA: APC family permease [Actinomycetota bacterium]
MPRIGEVVKRVLVGRAHATHMAEHQLLPKSLALPVFSSDPLSSVAYATEEIMLVLVLAGAMALRFTVPIALGITLVLAIVITSYRQTVRAYPRGGGSYIVARENLGTIPGLIAASAILIGYVVTAAVSVTAGSIAVTSAVPELVEQRVPIAIGFLVVIALANLRGVRESGMVFAVPTYGFVLTIYVTLLVGFARCLGGCPVAATADLAIEPHEALTALVLLRAFAQGSAALTGVEAIADGVQAFRRPKGRNAAATMAIMGSMGISMFVGITVLARLVDIRVSEDVVVSSSVLSQIGETVFGRGGMFFVLQAFTAMILIVAANTAYQDFPRLSAILARDRFMPRQFMNRGDRLVYSNGIVVLTVAASLLVWAFDATLTRLIPLYLVGVFTAFTLSQAGMVRRWLRLKEGPWLRNAIINGSGASATGLVLAVAVTTRFVEGSWMVVAAIPVIIAGLLSVHRHYERVRRELRSRDLSPSMEAENTMLVLVPRVDRATREMVSWLLAVRPSRITPLYIGSDDFEEAAGAWAVAAPRLPPLQPLEVRNGQVTKGLRRYIRRLPRGENSFVTVVLPEEVTTGFWLYVARRALTFRIKTALLFEPGVVVTDVPLLPEEAEKEETWAAGERALEPERNVCLVPVSQVHDGTIRAIVWARSIRPAHLEAVFLAEEPEEADELLAAWREAGIDVPLSIVEAPFRDYGPPLLEEVRRHSKRGDTVVTVVFPEFVVDRWWQQLLHNQNSFFMKRLLLFEPWVVGVSVPFHLGRPPIEAEKPEGAKTDGAS